MRWPSNRHQLPETQQSQLHEPTARASRRRDSDQTEQGKQLLLVRFYRFNAPDTSSSRHYPPHGFRHPDTGIRMVARADGSKPIGRKFRQGNQRGHSGSGMRRSVPRRRRRDQRNSRATRTIYAQLFHRLQTHNLKLSPPATIGTTHAEIPRPHHNSRRRLAKPRQGRRFDQNDHVYGSARS